MTGKGDNGKYGITIDDYLKIRTVAVQELSMGVHIEHNSSITPEQKTPVTHTIQVSHTPSIVKKERKPQPAYNNTESVTEIIEQKVSKEDEAIAILNAIAD